jgi:hypothetical protein
MKLSILVFLVILFMNSITAQEVISTTGKHIENDNGSISWTIGEPIIETILENENSVTQGFHQPSLAVPTLGHWGLIMCCLLLWIVGIITLRSPTIFELKQ